VGGHKELTTRVLPGRYSIIRGNHPDVSQDSIAPKITCPFLLRSLTSSPALLHRFNDKRMSNTDEFVNSGSVQVFWSGKVKRAVER
jgi:hypothetical protein